MGRGEKRNKRKEKLNMGCWKSIFNFECKRYTFKAIRSFFLQFTVTVAIATATFIGIHLSISIFLWFLCAHYHRFECFTIENNWSENENA